MSNDSRELRLSGLDAEGARLILVDDFGEQYELPVGEPLRALLQSDALGPAEFRSAVQDLRPRDIQARIRAGETAESVARISGLDLEHVRRYEGAVVDERAYIAEQARSATIGPEAEAPTLSQLVSQRLATRGVDDDLVKWDAYRRPDHPWTISVTFTVADLSHTGTWSFDPATKALSALDDDARWLSQLTMPDTPVPQRRLSAVHDLGYGMSDSPEDRADAVLDPGSPELDALVTEDILDTLASRRGKRPVDDDAFDDAELFDPADFVESFGLIPAAHPAASDFDSYTDAEILELPEQQTPVRRIFDDTVVQPTQPIEQEIIDEAKKTTDIRSAAKPAKKTPKSKRAQVPSWDEIVFGSKQD